jgi:hypothetical protein
VGNGEPKHRQSTQLLDTIYSAAIKYDYCVELMTAVNNLLGSMAFSGYKFTFHQSDHLTTLLVCGMRRFSDNVTLMITSCFAIAHMSFGKGMRDLELK